MRIAVVGGGVAGLAAAWLLNRHHEVTLFEAEPRLGGHINTVKLALSDGNVSVDAGFMVFNEHTYPTLTKLLEYLKVPTQSSNMSFAVGTMDGRLEYGASRRALLVQPTNGVRPTFLRMLLDVPRFNQLGRRFLAENTQDDVSVADFLGRHGFGQGLRDWYLLPMASAIWSLPPGRILDFPARTLLAFFAREALLNIKRHHRWRVVTGGAGTYVERMAAEFRSRIRLATPVIAVRRLPQGVVVRDAHGRSRLFDHVILACHADRSLTILEDASAGERDILGSIRFQASRAVLHSDVALMPQRRGAWASWNVAVREDGDLKAGPAVTYWLNRLQRPRTAQPLFVSLNPWREPLPSLVHAEFAYAHPVLDHAAVAAQARLPSIQGRGGVWHAGAWLGYGFHEDGLNAALAVAGALDALPPWQAQPVRAGSGAMGLPDGAAAQRV